MARTYAIKEIFQSGGVGSPARIELANPVGDVTNSFAGKFWRNSLGGTLPGYTVSPSGYTLIQATSFDVIGNPSYNGRYTTYSPISSGDTVTNPSSSFSAPNTTIRVAEVVGAPTTAGDQLLGSVTNISTYLITIFNEATLVIPPTVSVDARPVDFVGRNGSPWGEAFNQNFADLAQNFASATAPANPFIGQTWYNTGASPAPTFTIWNGGSWVVLGSVSPGSNNTVRVTQSVPSATWIVPHNLALIPPFVCLYQVFVDVGAGVHKEMIPSDVSFTNANSLTITFSSPQAGIVLLRS